MDYDLLLEGCCEAGVQLLRHGAEIYRAEDTVRRLLAAYQIQGDVFAIPNCLIVSFRDPEGKIHTRLRRVPLSSTDVDGIERFNALSRRLCANPPADPGEILRECKEEEQDLKSFPWQVNLTGYFIGAFFFTLFFNGGILEAFTGGFAGMVAGLMLMILDRYHTNFFVATMVSAAVSTIAACIPCSTGLVTIDTAMAGAIMVLVPGLVFTNFMSNLLTTDVVSGLSTFVRAILTAVAIALGTGCAITFCRLFWTIPSSSAPQDYAPALTVFFGFMACLGFCPAFNVRNHATLLSCTGGAIGWLAYLICHGAMHSIFLGNYAAAIAVAIWSQIMARVRHCPATSFLVISMLPLVPGLTIYQAMDYSLRGDTQAFFDTFFRCFGIAGCLAIGLLTVSTAVSVIHHIHARMRHEKV